MDTQDLLNIVSEESSLPIEQFFYTNCYHGYTQHPEEMNRVLARMHRLGMGVDAIIPTLDAAYDLLEARGMVSRWPLRDYERSSYQKWDMEELINTKIHYMLKHSPQACDLAFSLIRQGGALLVMKAIMKGFAIKGYYQHQQDLNLCRTASGQLRDTADFLLLPKNKTIARMLCDSAIFWEDLEAVRHVAAIPEYQKYVDDKFLAERVKELNNSLRSSGKRDTDLSLLNDLSEPNLEDYARLISTSEVMHLNHQKLEEVRGKVEPLFNPRLMGMAPAEFVYLLMTQSNIGVHPANIFLAKMAEAGVSTKAGFLMANKGRFFVTQFPQVKLTETEIVELCFEHKAKRGYIGMLFSVPLDVVAAHKKGQKLLDLMYELSPSNEIALRMDLKGRAKHFSNELGV